MSYSDDLDWLARNVHEWKDGKIECIPMQPYKVCNVVWSSSSPCEGWITKDQWLARRAELQNKPSWADAPEWANWLAQWNDGGWFWCGDEKDNPPQLGDSAWYQDGETLFLPVGEILGDWRDTLERRPGMRKTTEEIDTPAECAQEAEKSIPIGHKADHGKPILGAIPPHAELAVARVLTFGTEKYQRDGWQSVENAEIRYMDAALRHLNAHRRGEMVDDESGENHLAHAACCIMFMLDMQERNGVK